MKISHENSYYSWLAGWIPSLRPIPPCFLTSSRRSRILEIDAPASGLCKSGSPGFPGLDEPKESQTGSIDRHSSIPSPEDRSSPEMRFLNQILAAYMDTHLQVNPIPRLWIGWTITFHLHLNIIPDYLIEHLMWYAQLPGAHACSWLSAVSPQLELSGGSIQTFIKSDHPHLISFPPWQQW